MRNDVSMRDEADLPFVDVLGADFDRDAVGTLWAGAGGGQICRTRRGVEILDYATVATLISDPRLDSQDASAYRKMGGPASLLEFADEGLLVAMRGDTHRRIRRVLSAGFRVRHVTERRSAMHHTAAALVDAWNGPQCEFVAEFSSPFPMQVLCGLLGIPLSFVCFVGILIPIVGAVLGVVALSQIKRTNQQGRGLAIAGIVVGATAAVLLVLLVLGVMV